MDCATLFRKGTPFLALLPLFGCKEPPPLIFPEPLKGVVFDQPNAGYDLLLKAAAAIENDAATVIKTVDWTPGKRATAIAQSSRALNLLRSGLQKGPRVAHLPTAPGDPMLAVRGWRFLGKVLVFRMQSAIDRGDVASAANDFLLLNRFGLVLLSGDTSLGTLGMSMTAEARDVLWRETPKLDATKLSSLGREVASRLRDAPSESMTLEQERKTMMKGVEWLIGNVRKGNYATIDATLGRPVEKATHYLKELMEEKPSSVPALFQGLIQEGDGEIAFLQRQAALPPFKRDLQPDEPSGERPWKRFSAALFRSGRYFLTSRAKFEAEMRLFAIDCQLLAGFKKNRSVPRTLAAFPGWLVADPFSDRGFVYQPRGVDFKLYSVGPNGIDDGGTAADLTPRR